MNGFTKRHRSDCEAYCRGEESCDCGAYQPTADPLLHQATEQEQGGDEVQNHSVDAAQNLGSQTGQPIKDKLSSADYRATADSIINECCGQMMMAQDYELLERRIVSALGAAREAEREQVWRDVAEVLNMYVGKFGDAVCEEVRQNVMEDITRRLGYAKDDPGYLKRNRDIDSDATTQVGSGFPSQGVPDASSLQPLPESSSKPASLACTECPYIFSAAEVAAEDKNAWGHPCHFNGLSDACESFRESVVAAREVITDKEKQNEE